MKKIKGLTSFNRNARTVKKLPDHALSNSTVMPRKINRTIEPDIKCCYFNARSLRNKFEDLEILAATNNYHVIGITESWLDTANRDFVAEYSLPKYSIFSCERENKNGGGVILYVHNSLHPTALERESVPNVDTLFVDLKNKCGKSKVTIGLVYRPPKQTVENDEKLFDSILEASQRNETIIMGDFNLPVKRWGDNFNSHTGRNLYTNLLESDFHQCVNEPTRGSNILDLILSTTENLVNEVNIGPMFSTSDHRSITFKIKFVPNKLKFSKEKVPDFRKANFNRLRSILENSDWSIISKDIDIDNAWKNFTTELNNAVCSCVPFRERRPATNKPKWWNREISNNLASKKRAYKKYLLTKSQADKLILDKIRRETKASIKFSKKKLEEYIAEASKTNPKEFFSYANKKKTLTGGIGPLKDNTGNHTNDENEMATILNNFFASVFTDEDCSTFQPSEQQLTLNQLNQIEINESDVVRVIDKLPVNKTPGPDKISPRIIREVKHQISKPLCILFNKSLTLGKVPSDWKCANVTPIFKKGDKSLPSNYRPISLTSIISKLLETIIRDNMVNFLEENKILKDSQHGFRCKRSCLTNLLDFFHDVFNQFDECRSVDVIYLDFQKAFDKVPHKRLIDKLKSHGICGSIQNWINDWLTSRKQRVVINGTSSCWLDVKSGVPQGSVLGPILFLIYVNDLDNGLLCKVSKFADDTKLASKVTSAEERETLQSDLDKLTCWAAKWQMKFNVNKCKVLHIGSNNDHVQYRMNGEILEAVNKEKDLGILISSDLKPSQHCSEVVKKANKLVGFIGRVFENKSEKIMLKLYNSLVRPHLEYCVQFWSPYYQKDINKLERVQRRLTKMIPRLRNMTYEERLKILKLFPLSIRRMRGDLIEVFKMFKGFDNVSANNYFSLDRSNRRRHHDFKIIGKRFSSNESKHFFFNRVVNVWNSLPSAVVDSNTLATFKNRLDKYMTANPQIKYYPF